MMKARISFKSILIITSVLLVIIGTAKNARAFESAPNISLDGEPEKLSKEELIPLLDLVDALALQEDGSVDPTDSIRMAVSHSLHRFISAMRHGDIPDEEAAKAMNWKVEDLNMPGATAALRMILARISKSGDGLHISRYFPHDRDRILEFRDDENDLFRLKIRVDQRAAHFSIEGPSGPTDSADTWTYVDSKDVRGVRNIYRRPSFGIVTDRNPQFGNAGHWNQLHLNQRAHPRKLEEIKGFPVVATLPNYHDRRSLFENSAESQPYVVEDQPYMVELDHRQLITLATLFLSNDTLYSQDGKSMPSIKDLAFVDLTKANSQDRLSPLNHIHREASELRSLTGLGEPVYRNDTKVVEYIHGAVQSVHFGNDKKNEPFLYIRFIDKSAADPKFDTLRHEIYYPSRDWVDRLYLVKQAHLLDQQRAARSNNRREH